MTLQLVFTFIFHLILHQCSKFLVDLDILTVTLQSYKAYIISNGQFSSKSVVGFTICCLLNSLQACCPLYCLYFYKILFRKDAGSQHRLLSNSLSTIYTESRSLIGNHALCGCQKLSVSFYRGLTEIAKFFKWQVEAVIISKLFILDISCICQFKTINAALRYYIFAEKYVMELPFDLNFFSCSYAMALQFRI